MIFIWRNVYFINPDSILSFGEYWHNLILLSLIVTYYPVFGSDRCQSDKSLGILTNFPLRKLYVYIEGEIAQTEKVQKINQ